MGDGLFSGAHVGGEHWWAAIVLTPPQTSTTKKALDCRRGGAAFGSNARFKTAIKTTD